MRLTIAQLEAFVWVARLGKVRDAAFQLNISQPTVSLRLRDLEQALGFAVFERKGRRNVLTRDGIVMLEHADIILGELAKIRSRSETEEITGTVQLGVSETFAIGGLPSLFLIIGKRYPKLKVELSVGPSGEIIEHLHQRRLDLAVVVSPNEDARLRIVPLGIQQSIWAATPGLSLPRPIKPVDLHQFTIFVNPAPSPNYRQTMAWFASAGLEPMNVSYCNTVPSVVAHLVEAGVGVSILPTRLIEPQLNAGTLVGLNCHPPIDNAYLCAVCRANETLPAVGAALDAVRLSLAASDLLEVM